MSLVAKIPPVVSAIAFGYGVGMSAPDAALESVKGAMTPRVHTQQTTGQSPYLMGPASANPRLVQNPYAAPNPYAQPMQLQGDRFRAPTPGAGESPELAELRRTGAYEPRHAGGACPLHGPTYTQHDPYGHQSVEAPAYDFEMLDPASSEQLSRLILPDMRVSVSQQSMKYVRYFTRSQKGRGMYNAWLKRSGKYQEMVQEELRRWRLPEDLMWVAMIESGFDPTAKSPAGAVGLWQFMPATGGVYGLRQTTYLDQRKNPRLATEAAAHHLRDLYMRFGDWELALAAYNMGYEQLLDRIDRYGTSDFNELVRQGALPKETAKYVPKITAAAIVANNLEQFEFTDVKISPPLDVAEMAVPAGTPLKIIARASGVSTNEIRKLNPDILSQVVPPGRGDYLIYVPAEQIARARAALPAMLQVEKEVVDDMVDPVDLLGGTPAYARSVPSQDDSLLSMLPRYKPKRDKGTLRRPLDEEDLVADAQQEDKGDDDSRRAGRKTLYYRVGQGETLIGIARSFAMDIEDVAGDNGLTTKSQLKEGQLLKLRVSHGMLDDHERVMKSEREGKAAKRDKSSS